MPVNDNNDLVNPSPQSMDAITAINQLIPPQYGEHEFDQLYSDIDPAGYTTPGGGISGINTPFESQSRSVSTDNLASMDQVAVDDLAASVLEGRLTNLDVAGNSGITRERNLQRSQIASSGDDDDGHIEAPRQDDSNTPQNPVHPRGYFQHPGSETNPDDGSPVIRRLSEDDETASGPTTRHIEYSAEVLAKVPSYTTALQSQTRTPVNDGLPTYQNATRPSSPSPPQAPR